MHFKKSTQDTFALNDLASFIEVYPPRKQVPLVPLRIGTTQRREGAKVNAPTRKPIALLRAFA
jgi:hypothetical protein